MKYAIYEIKQNHELCYTNDIEHAMQLVKEFDKIDDTTKHSIRVIEK